MGYVKPPNGTYLREELQQLTTLQLREICRIEKLPVGVAYKLDRAYMINTILKYRGAGLQAFIDAFVPGRNEKIMGNSLKLLLTEAGRRIIVPTRITLYKGIDTTERDDYEVSGERLSEGNVLLLDHENRVHGALNLRESETGFRLTCNHQLLEPGLREGMYRNYSLAFLEDISSRRLCGYYYSDENFLSLTMRYSVKPIAELLIVDAEKAGTSLTIDFGTSNTAAGSYLCEYFINGYVREDMQKNGIALNTVSKVSFTDTLGRTPEETEILPTVVSVRDCSDPNNIKYRFGYDAIKAARQYVYDNPASVFYGIKKWVNNYRKLEEIADEDGNTATAPRGDILRAYFLHVIAAAERQHKCRYESLHLTSPVKQKSQFLEMYKEILPDYQIVTETALDEGISVLYNSISNQIENRDFEDGAEYHALVIDCGGGTTDLTSCVYTIEDNQITYKLDLTTTYVNGETNFGGNNITFRVFQYLKTLFSRWYTGEGEIRIEQIFDAELSDVYRYVDANGLEKTYERLNAMYAESEKVIPTRYNDYRKGSSEDYRKVRSNFYFLWNLAERVKIDFFQNIGVNATSFHEHGIKSNARDPKILAEESWRLHVRSNERRHNLDKNITTERAALILRTDFPDIVIAKEEIVMLIKADIYYVIKKFIEPIYQQDELSDYSIIKLTGQTCKIDIFRDAMKEFIPGRLLESSNKAKTVRDLKLSCLEGAVKCQNARRIGLIAPTLNIEAPITPYKLIAYTFNGAETLMIASLEKISKSYGYVSRNIDTEDVELTLLDAAGKILHTYPVRTAVSDFRRTDYEETTREYAEKIPQDDIDSIVDDEIKLFTFAYTDKWGFYVLPLARRNGQLLTGERKYLPFENGEWETNFFDGRK